LPETPTSSSSATATDDENEQQIEKSLPVKTRVNEEEEQQQQPQLHPQQTLKSKKPIEGGDKVGKSSLARQQQSAKNINLNNGDNREEKKT